MRDHPDDHLAERFEAMSDRDKIDFMIEQQGWAIEAVQPDTVCVELCESRAQSIRQKNLWQEMDIIKVIREKKARMCRSQKGIG